ncbi:MAG: MFS transporter [Anaerolineae bacterium]|nr:MFS transporter [Anaerolineae bacterium]
MTFPPALRHRQYALFWGGLMVSLAGSQMQLAAVLWHLRTLSDQPVVVTGIGLARFLPILLFAPLGGLVADWFNRRRVLFVTQTAQLAVALALGMLTLSGRVTVWHIYFLSALQALAMSFDLPARQSIVSNLVPDAELSSAFSLQSIAFNTGAIVGPALGGSVIAYLGQEYTYLINAMTFVVVLLALLWMGEVAQETPSQPRSVFNGFQSIAEGVQFIMRKPVILSAMILDFIATFFASANYLLPFVVRDVLHVGEIQYGWLASAQAIGAVGVGLLVSQRARIRRQGVLILFSVIGFGLATFGFGLAKTFAFAMLALILVGASDSLSTILRNTLRQMLTPDSLRGRMVSINQIFFIGGPQLGEIEAGMVAQAFGTQAAILSGGVLCVLGALVIARCWPQLARYTDESRT